MSNVKSNFNDNNVNFVYKRYEKLNVPVQLDTVMVADPKDSGVTTLLTIKATIMRAVFWQEPDPMAKLLKKVVGTFITDHRRNQLCLRLEKEVSLLPPIETKTR